MSGDVKEKKMVSDTTMPTEAVVCGFVMGGLRFSFSRQTTEALLKQEVLAEWGEFNRSPEGLFQLVHDALLELEKLGKVRIGGDRSCPSLTTVSLFTH